jgi:uncharacterized protein YbaR (Trm112 family)
MEHEVYCERCENAYLIKDIKLTQSGNHLRADCPMCGRFLKFVQQTEPSGDDILPFGKYKDKTVDWVCTNDNAYALWASENMKGRYQKSFKKCLNI